MSSTNQNDDSAKAVQALLENMQARFQHLSDSIIRRIDEMGNRIDDLEKNIANMMKENESDVAISNTTTTTSGDSSKGALKE